MVNVPHYHSDGATSMSDEESQNMVIIEISGQYTFLTKKYISVEVTFSIKLTVVLKI